MDESVQVEQYVGVQIIDYVYCKNACSFLYPIHMSEVVPLERPKKMNRLLIIVIFEDLLNKFLNFYLLLFDHIVDDGLHPGEISVHVTAPLTFHVLSAV